MAHFSLGNALLQVGKPGEAADSFERCIAVNSSMSKAYQLAGQAYQLADRRDDAIRVLTEGYKIAARRGDLAPKNAMAEMLESLDAPVPEEARPVAAEDLPEGTFICQVTGRPGTQLDKPPFRGPLGQKIYETVSKEAWQEWIGQGTKVINELRLDLSREDHSQVYDQHMIEFLGLEQWAAEHQDELNSTA
ncbi:MAG: Fe(2+)-trafficking protein [Phycisphaerales bacterium]